MRDIKRFHTRGLFHFALLAAGMSLFAGLFACGSPKSAQPEQAPRRYALTGRVVAIEPAKQQIVVDGADIPGFMMAMTMPYSVKNPNLLESVAPEDQIKADVVVNGRDVYLENIVVVKKPDQAKNPSSGQSQPASPQPRKQ
ncbi:MAG TPA: copper-binding protein [Candidatus Dormibacteraeota bacterium]|nr:copper-binding protein [Candidatus Dormibacteraeota bacterium]